MNKLNLIKGWIKISNDEMSQLKLAMYNRYKQDGGTNDIGDFNSHLPNYEEIISLIEQRLDLACKKNNWQIFIDHQEYKKPSPGKTFLKHLFYIKRDEINPQFQRINIDLCYLYAYEKTREQYMLNTQPVADEKYLAPLKMPHKFILSYIDTSLEEAQKIELFLKKNIQVTIKTDIRNSPIFRSGNLKELYNKLETDEFVLLLLSRNYLKNEDTTVELIDFFTNNALQFVTKTIIIVSEDIYKDEYNIFSTMGKIAMTAHWKLHIEKLEYAFNELVGDASDSAADSSIASNISESILKLKEIKKKIFDFLVQITQVKSTVRYEVFFQKIKAYEDLTHLLPTREQVEAQSTFENIYNAISIPSNNDPARPEFPPAPNYTPKFPASETYAFQTNTHTNVWLKDESTNPTGTHKDRFAWEVVLKYLALMKSQAFKNKHELPQISIITSGSAATAIQNLFNQFNIPTRLKTLVDKTLDNSIKQSMKQLGCELYETDLSEKLLLPEDIKRLTNNTNGIDITYRETLDPNHDNYYDWLSYEIINQQPDYCFVPFGTGDLFINILNIAKKEYFNSFLRKHDPRFSASIQSLKNCHYIAATTHNKNTQLKKLYSSFLPSFETYTKFLDELKSYGCIGKKSTIAEIHESHVDEAILLANSQNINFEPSGIAGLAMFLQMKHKIPSDKKVLIVNTGKTKSAEELLGV